MALVQLTGPGPTGNDSATTRGPRGIGYRWQMPDVIENESSSVSETGGSSPLADIAVSDSGNTLQTPETNSLSAADSSTESITSASVQPISAGNGQTVNLGDVSNTDVPGASGRTFIRQTIL